MSGDRAYGLWPLVVLNTGLFVVFAARLRQLPPGGTPGVGDPTAPSHSRRVHPGSEV